MSHKKEACGDNGAGKYESVSKNCHFKNDDF